MNQPDYNQAIKWPTQKLPVVVQFPINDICNSRCQMCNIWQQKQGQELSVADVRSIFSQSLFREVAAVGINGGEPTLRKDIGALTNALAESLPKLKSLHLITNAIVEPQVRKAIDNLTEVCRSQHLHLDVMVSLDGIGEVHDRVRGRVGNFETAAGIIEFCLNNPLVHTTRVGCTIIKENVQHLEDHLVWCQQHGVKAYYRVGIPHQRLYSLDFPDPRILDREEMFHLANFLDYVRLHYETDPLRQEFYLSLRDQLVYGRPRTAGCSWQNEGVTVFANGELGYCAVESKNLGQLKTNNAEQLYWDNADHLKSILDHKCDRCLHDYTGRRVEASQMLRMFESTMQFGAALSRPIIGERNTSKIGQAIRALATAFKSKAQPVQYLRSRKQVAEDVLLLSKNALETESLPERILLCGWYGTETLGDKAILGGISGILAERCGCEIDLASIEPYVSKHTLNQMPEIPIQNVIGFDEALERLGEGEYRAVIIAGGPLMSPVGQVWDLYRFFREIRKQHGAAIVAGCGIGPLTVKRNNAAIWGIVRLATDCLLRDAGSRENFEQTFQEELACQIILDPAFLWINNNIKQNTHRDPQKVLLALREWQIAEYAGDLSIHHAEKLKKHFEHEIRQLPAITKELTPELSITPFCMHKYAVGGDDRFFYRRVFSSHEEILSRVCQAHQIPQQDLQEFQTSRLVLAMRFHSVVFALATGTPFLAIDYTRGGKISGLLNMLGMQDRLITMEDFTADKFAEWASLELKQPTIASWNLEQQIKVTRDKLQSCFSGITVSISSSMVNSSILPR